MGWMKTIGAALLCLLVLQIADPALAQERNCSISESNNILDCIVGGFQNASQSWEEELRVLAIRLFWLLALIEFTWAALSLALRGADISEWLSSLINQIFFIGFFAALLQFSAEWARAIIDSFTSAADIASGAPDIRPSNIFELGIQLALSLPMGGTFDIGPKIASLFAGFFLVIAFGLIAATLIVALVESYIVISAGVLMMGFGGSRWTKDYALRTFQYCLSVGAKLFVIQLLAGLAFQLLQPWASETANNPEGISLTSLLVLVGTSLVFLAIIRQIPEMVQALINGTSPSTGTGLASSIASTASGVAVGAIGASMAVRSADKLASEQLKTADADGSGPNSRLGRAAYLTGRSANNLAGSFLTNVGDRISGRVAGSASRLGGMSDSMDRKAQKLQKDREKPKDNKDGGSEASSPPPGPQRRSPPSNNNIK